MPNFKFLASSELLSIFPFAFAFAFDEPNPASLLKESISTKLFATSALARLTCSNAKVICSTSF
jgi:hypothetical protein